MTFTPCSERCGQPDHCAVNGCFGEKARSVGFTSPYTVAVNNAETAQRKDMDAYKSMRRQGIQPERIQGSHDAMLTDTQHVIEGRPDPKEVERVADTWSPDLVSNFLPQEAT